MTTAKILDGPERSDLLLSLSDGKIIEFNVDKNPHSTKLTNHEKVSIQITSLEMEDGSRNRWIFKGINIKTKGIISGYYHSGVRKGHSDYQRKAV